MHRPQPQPSRHPVHDPQTGEESENGLKTEVRTLIYQVGPQNFCLVHSHREEGIAGNSHREEGIAGDSPVAEGSSQLSRLPQRPQCGQENASTQRGDAKGRRRAGSRGTEGTTQRHMCLVAFSLDRVSSPGWAPISLCIRMSLNS